MRPKLLLRKIKRVLFLLRKKGLRYTLNYVHFSILFATKNSFLVKLLYRLESYPSYLEIEVTTQCPLRCIFCERTYWQEPNRDMSFDQFKYIIDQFPGLKWIGLTGIGESFVNKDFLKMLRYVKGKNVFVELYDNFFLINERIAKELIDLGIDKMFISFDAATKETYEKLRPGSNFERVVDNLKNFFKLKVQAQTPFPQISFHYVVNSLNLREIPQYIDLVHDLSPERNTDIQFSRMLHSFKEVENLFVEIPQDIVNSAEEKAKRLGLKLVWSADAPKEKPPIQKCTEWTMPFIFVNGDVIPCCAGNEGGRREFQKKTAMGNIFQQSFKEIWQGERYRNLRMALKEGKSPPACYNCPLYQSNANLIN